MRTPIKLHLHRWAVGRPIALAMPAQDAALMARNLAKFCDWFRDGQIAERTAGNMPDHATWLEMYRDQWGVKEKLIDTFLGPEVAPLDGSVAAFFTKSAMNAARDPVRQMMAGMKMDKMPYLFKLKIRKEIEGALRYQYQEHLKALAAELEEGPAPSDPTLDALFAKPEALFGVLVVLPCLLENEEWPWTLYERACKQGDMAAVEKLLRIDKTLIRDEEIGELVASLRGPKADTLRELIADAYAGYPRLKLEPGRLYGVGAGAISLLAEQLGCKVSTEDFKNLFDAGTKDRSGDPVAIEMDWPDSPEAQRQEIHRGKSFWVNIFPRDTESSMDCHAELGLMAVVSDRDEEAVRPAWLDQALQGAPAPQPKQGGGILARMRSWLGG